MNARLAISAAVVAVCAACTPAAPPALTTAEVQQFVRDYAAAANAANASKVMEMVLREQSVSSIFAGKIDRGWEAIRSATDATLSRPNRAQVALGMINVTPLAPDAALAVGTMNFIGSHQIGNMTFESLPGAFTIVVKRTPEGLRLIHEHYSVRAP